jgi:hypothetical protein
LWNECHSSYWRSQPRKWSRSGAERLRFSRASVYPFWPLPGEVRCATMPRNPNTNGDAP